MHRIDHATATEDNKFTGGNPASSTPATVVTADWLNACQEEVANAIEGAGIVLDKENNTQLLEALRYLIPAGTVQAYAGTEAPVGYLLCHGQTVNRETYARLFTAIGVTFGAGNGSTTFALPDLRGRVVAGKDNMGGTAANRLTNTGVGNSGINGSVLGAAGSLDRHTLTIAEMPHHAHEIPSMLVATTAGATGRIFGFEDQDQGTWGVGGDQAHTNVQPTMVLNYIIKT